MSGNCLQSAHFKKLSVNFNLMSYFLNKELLKNTDHIALLHNFLCKNMVHCNILSILNIEIKLIKRNNGKNILMKHDIA